MIIGQTLILLIGALTELIVFFRRSATALFEEPDYSITGAALYIMDDIAEEALNIYNSLEDPLELYRSDPDACCTALRSRIRSGFPAVR